MNRSGVTIQPFFYKSIPRSHIFTEKYTGMFDIPGLYGILQYRKTIFEKRMDLFSMDFTIVTAAYKARECLGKCLDSVQETLLPGTEQIVVDNLSMDGTDLLVKEYSHVKFISEADSGIYDAMNKGIKHSSGKIISFLNADDSYLPGTLAKVKKAFEEHPECSVVYGNIMAECSVRQPVRPLFTGQGSFTRQPFSEENFLNGMGGMIPLSGSVQIWIFSCGSKKRRSRFIIWMNRWRYLRWMESVPGGGNRRHRRSDPF